MGMQRVLAGDVGTGGGWLARAARLVEEDGTDSVAAGLLTAACAFEALTRGDPDRAVELLDDSVAAGRRLDSPELLALALHQQGLLLLEAGRTDEGLARLDEAMLERGLGRLSPMVTGIVYCGVIAGCWSVYELRRAQQWTAAMTDVVRRRSRISANFTGECKVRRAELKQLNGDWAGRPRRARRGGASADAGPVGRREWRRTCAETSTGSREVRLGRGVLRRGEPTGL